MPTDALKKAFTDAATRYLMLGPMWYRAQIEAVRVREYVSVADWIEKNFRLTTAYAVQGQVKLYPWQVEPANAIQQYDEVIFIAPVQTGKSMLGEAITGYIVDNTTMNVMITYSKKEVVEDVFDERLKPFVREVPEIRKYWSGNEDDLTKRRIKLTHLIIRIASAAVRSDLATHNAGFIYGVELAKWPEKDFDQVRMLFGRTQASRMVGKKVKALFETSPIYEGDKSYTEAFKPGTLFLQPFYPCPKCGSYQPLVDSQVKEELNSKGKKDHDPERIRRLQAAYYECPYCRGRIRDDDRFAMMQKVKWAAPKIKRGKFTQDSETFDKNGRILKRRAARRVVYNWNRFVDTSWTFSECLATYFEALNSPDPTALRTYRNEDMADWVRLASRRPEDAFLASKKIKYVQKGEQIWLADGVRILLAGIDTQDNGFYFVIRGWGVNLESWLIREQFVPCDMNDEKYTDPHAVYSLLRDELTRFPFMKHTPKGKPAARLPILFGLIDRGGHRARDVDYFVQHMTNMGAYIGSTQKNAPLITVKDGRFWGHTENLSRVVQKQIESSLWHLPLDVSREYSRQVLNQFDEEYKDTRGNTKTRWLTKDPDHFRDCENYIVGALNETSLNLQSYLFDEDTAKSLEQTVVKAQTPQKPGQQRRPSQKEGTAGRQVDVNRIQSDYLEELTSGIGGGRW